MANIMGLARTNYVKVKDLQGLSNALKDLDIEVLNHIETPCSFERFTGISTFFTENVVVGKLGEGLEKLAGIYFSGKALAVFPRRYRRLGNSKNIAQPFLRKALVRAKCLNISSNEILHRLPFSTANKSLTG